MARTGRLRAFRIVLLALGTLIAVPTSVVLRGILFPPRLDVPTRGKQPLIPTKSVASGAANGGTKSSSR